jgi:hypothetical protein
VSAFIVVRASGARAGSRDVEARLRQNHRCAQERIRHRECFNIGGIIGRGDLDYATAFTALVAAAYAMPTYRDPWRNLDERVARSIKAGMVRLPFS